MTGERRRYWRSVTALMVVLPAAIVVNSWDSLSEWRRSQMRTPITVERGSAQAYAGAEWQLTGLTRLPGATPDTTLVVAEFDAVVDDPTLLQAGPCAIANQTSGAISNIGPLLPCVRAIRPGQIDDYVDGTTILKPDQGVDRRIARVSRDFS